MATKGYSFQDDEKTIIDIDIGIVVEKEKNVPVLFSEIIFFEKFEISKLVINVFVGEKWRIFSCLTKLLTDETEPRRTFHR